MQVPGFVARGLFFQLAALLGANKPTRAKVAGLVESVQKAERVTYARLSSGRPELVYGTKVLAYAFFAVLFVAACVAGLLKYGKTADAFGNVFMAAFLLLPALACVVAIFLERNLTLTAGSISYKNRLGGGFSIPHGAVKSAVFGIGKHVDNGIETPLLWVRLVTNVGQHELNPDEDGFRDLARLLPPEARQLQSEF